MFVKHRGATRHSLVLTPYTRTSITKRCTVQHSRVRSVAAQGSEPAANGHDTGNGAAPPRPPGGGGGSSWDFGDWRRRIEQRTGGMILNVMAVVGTAFTVSAAFQFVYKLFTAPYDIKQLDKKIDTSTSTLKGKIETTRQELGDKIDTTRKELEDKIDTTRKELEDKIDTTLKELEDKIDTSTNKLEGKIDKLGDRILLIVVVTAAVLAFKDRR